MAEEGIREQLMRLLMRGMMGGRALAAIAALLFAFALPAAYGAPKDRGPAWASLTADQQQVLAPLAAEWSKLPRDQKTKWLGIAKRYPKMKPEEQKRAQERMQRWSKLTPEQRWEAREQYRSIGKAAQNRQELRKYWADYQALPPHEKRMFDVPPSYVPPAERRQRAKSPKAKPHSAFVLPAPL